MLTDQHFQRMADIVYIKSIKRSRIEIMDAPPLQLGDCLRWFQHG